MVLKLYGYPKSTCTRLVALVCREKEIPFKFVSVDLTKGEQKSADFIKNQPFGKVPYIDDDGFILYESRAIARYLIRKYPNQGTPGLVPTDLEAEALFEQASSTETFNFNHHVGPLMYEKMIRPLIGGETDQVRVGECLKQLEANLDVYNTILGRQRYLAGDNVTLADLQHLPHGSMLFAMGYGDMLLNRPNVARWWSDISNRPTWIAVQNGIF